ncbi:MAG: molybdopterin-dependent oxidoreductase, partial [Candidatus Thalassarchaeum sp.]|nr:molybdopterin-dependent oxidoreductase [Candidatus Thalassarchaeum sp.]
RHGGIAQGVAQALTEEVSYDADGNPQSANFADYGIISMAELPSVRVRGTTLRCYGSESLSDLSKEIQMLHR